MYGSYFHLIHFAKLITPFEINMYRIAGISGGGGGKTFVDARICSDSW